MTEKHDCTERYTLEASAAPQCAVRDPWKHYEAFLTRMADQSRSPLGSEQLAKCFLRPPFPLSPPKRCCVRVDESNQYLRHDPATNRAKTMTTCEDVRFAENVVPQRRLATPTRRSNADLLCGERSGSKVAGQGLARRQADTLSSLQVTNGEGMIGFNFALTSDRYRQLNECLHKLSIDLLRPLRECRTRCIEEQRPIDYVLARYSTESQ